VFVAWEGKPVELKPFSLRAVTWAERFFFREGIDGFERMNSILNNSEGQEIFFNSVIDIVYYLGEADFDKIGVGTPVILKIKVAKSEDKIEIIETFKTRLEEVLVNSFPDPKQQRPEFKGGKQFDEINKGRKTSKPENWDQIYIAFYRAGGMTIDQFMKMTMRQISPLMDEIQHKHAEDLNLLSDLIHKKIAIKKPHRKQSEMDFTEKEVKTFEKMHQQLVEQSRIN